MLMRIEISKRDQYGGDVMSVCVGAFFVSARAPRRWSVQKGCPYALSRGAPTRGVPKNDDQENFRRSARRGVRTTVVAVGGGRGARALDWAHPGCMLQGPDAPGH